MFFDINYEPYQGRVLQNNGYLSVTPSSPLNHWVQSFWQLNVPDGPYFYRSVPDNSVDLIINLACPEDAFIVTPFSTATVFELTGPVSYFGIRFRLMGHQGLITLPLGEWGESDEDVSVTDILPHQTLHTILDCISNDCISNDCISHPLPFTALCNKITSVLLKAATFPNIDIRLARFIRYSHHHKYNDINLTDEQCSEFGLSARQLRRLANLYLGLSPKKFIRVMKFQHSLQIMNATRDKLVWANHYYDQPHFIREFKGFSGLTPTKFSNLSVLYNKDVS